MSYFIKLIGRVLKWAIIVGLGLTVVVAVVAFFAIRAFISLPSLRLAWCQTHQKAAR